MLGHFSCVSKYFQSVKQRNLLSGGRLESFLLKGRHHYSNAVIRFFCDLFMHQVFLRFAWLGAKSWCIAKVLISFRVSLELKHLTDIRIYLSSQ